MFLADAPILAQNIAPGTEVISDRARDGAPLGGGCEAFAPMADAVNPRPTRTGARLNLQRN